MENNIKDAFESLTMPEACDEKIRAALHTTSRPNWRPLTVAACLVLALLVLIQPPVVQAVEKTIEMLFDISFVYDRFPGATIETVRQHESGSVVEIDGFDADGNRFVYGWDDMSMPDWLDPRTDGLYYIADGETVEISGLISEETPFIAQFTDDTGIRHSIAVGGTYGSGEQAMDEIGWADWTQESPYDDTSWLSGRAKNHLDAEGNGRSWFETAKDAMGIPWS